MNDKKATIHIGATSATLRFERASGFTLIELMIVVAIVAILSAIAVPSYREYVQRARITEALAILNEARMRMENYFQDNRSYPTAGCVVSPAVAGSGAIQLPASTNSFSIGCSSLTNSSYVLTVNGSNSMLGFSYSINDQGVRTSAFSGAASTQGWASASPNTCWATRKNGGCS
jgi:type IV pilus assembly protein PilE